MFYKKMGVGWVKSTDTALFRSKCKIYVNGRARKNSHKKTEWNRAITVLKNEGLKPTPHKNADKTDIFNGSSPFYHP